VHRSADAANYARGDERVDFLYASRPIARRLLATAAELDGALGKLRIVSAEGLIAKAPFAAAGGLDESPRREEDPYRSLDLCVHSKASGHSVSFSPLRTDVVLALPTALPFDNPAGKTDEGASVAHG
jgi:hypothetical protein